jgi:cytochrome c oxidase assembly protein subunit 15
MERVRVVGAGDVLTVGLGTSAAMWAWGYLCRLPYVTAPSWLLGVGLLVTLLAGGAAGGRWSGGWRLGALGGLLASFVNLLVLGGALAGGRTGIAAPSMLLWVPGSLLMGLILGGVGAALAARRPVSPPGWTAALAGVAASATLLQLVIGGLVTSTASGLAVVDWPNSFGYNMFLYPLSRMTGGVYYEHAHRLFGTLVGLITVALAIHLMAAQRRGWVRRLGLAAVVVVVVQGILGGLRVTGHLTTSTDPAAMAPSIGLAVVHGVLGPLFFGLLVSLAVITTPSWERDDRSPASPRAATDRTLAAAALAAAVVQLVLGALQRHIGWGLFVHVAFAVVVLALAVASGARLSGLYSEPVLVRCGRAAMAVASVQVVLGVLALAAVGARVAGAPRPAWQVLLTTAHQGTGALLLGVLVATVLWTRRLVAGEA